MSIAADNKPKTRWLAFWLVLGHFLAGLIGCAMARSHGPSLPQAAFIGLVFSQTSLLGLWAGLGSTNWLVRFGSVLVSLIYLGVLFCAGVKEVDVNLVLMIAFAGLMVAVLLVIGRRFGIKLHGSSVTGMETPTQFSIRQLMIFTFLVATLLTAARWLRPQIEIREELPLHFFLISVPFIILGLVAAWLLLATRRPAMGTIVLLLLAPLLGFGLNRVFDMTSPHNPFNSAYWITATTTAVIVLIVSLYVIRRCGFRIRRQRKGETGSKNQKPKKELERGK